MTPHQLAVEETRERLRLKPKSDLEARLGFVMLAVNQLQMEGVDWRAVEPKPVPSDPRLTVREQYDLLKEAITAKEAGTVPIITSSKGDIKWQKAIVPSIKVS
jgi:hypothetical protein